jgi:hypothetical protein
LCLKRDYRDAKCHISGGLQNISQQFKAFQDFEIGVSLGCLQVIERTAVRGVAMKAFPRKVPAAELIGEAQVARGQAVHRRIEVSLEREVVTVYQVAPTASTAGQYCPHCGQPITPSEAACSTHTNDALLEKRSGAMKRPNLTDEVK